MSNNPYQPSSDFNTGSQFDSGGPSPDVYNKVKAPATGLLVYGILSTVLAFFGIIMAVLNMAGVNPMMQNQEQQFEQIKQQAGGEQAEFIDMMSNMNKISSGPLGLVTNGLVFAIGILTIFTSNKMKRLEGHTMSMVVSVLACIPCTSGCCIVGIPIGVWAIVVLLDSNVKAAFRA